MNPLILINKEHPEITILTLNHPEKRNALSFELMSELYLALEEIQKDSTCRVVILQGAGSVFCTGLNLKEALDLDLMKESAELLKKIYSMLYSFPLITIALVQGAAIAGGAGLMSVCDYIICTDNAKFGFPETRRGLIASIVMTFIKGQISERDARELFLLGELINAERALQMRLINKIVPESDLFEEGIKSARLVLKGAPMATSESKRFLGILYSKTFTENLKSAEAFHIQARVSDEAKEGVRSFLEKRDPVWKL